MLRILWRGALVFAALIVAFLVIFLAYRAWRQHITAQALAITTPNGIDDALYVPVRGIGQWVQIRGDDRNNPVLLFVHGGPGSSETPMSSLLQPWEKYFTVVMWDQRCAGKTFARNGEESCNNLTLDGVARDGIALTQYLRHRLHQRKIVVLGHSWGSMVGLRMVRAKPDLYSAFVTTGLVVSIPEKEPENYARTMALLRAAHDEKGIEALKKVGPPPYKTAADLMVERRWSGRYDIPSERNLYKDMMPLVWFAPGWSLGDIYAFLHAPNLADKATYNATVTYDARSLGLNFDVPFFVFNGAQDTITPSDLAKSYFDSVQAPVKHFALLSDAGHSAVMTRPGEFLQDLVTYVRPVAVAAQNGASHG